MGGTSKKPYLLLHGRPILHYVIEALDNSPSIDKIIVAVSPGEEARCQTEVVQGGSFKKKVLVVQGGATRQESVQRLLAGVPDDSSMVLIHDGARPLITIELIERAIKETQCWKATVMAVPVKDTIKFGNDEAFVEQTLQRERLWSIQTPQTFEKSLIYEAHRRAFQDGFIGTDDAALVERLGTPVKIIMGSYDNIKITTPEDLLAAEALMKKRIKQPPRSQSTQK